MEDEDQRIIELAPTAGYVRNSFRKNDHLKYSVSEIERKIEICLEDYESEEGRADYIIVTHETFIQMDKLGLIEEYKESLFLPLGEVNYLKERDIKVILPEDIEIVGDEKAMQRYNDIIKNIRNKPLVFARTKYCKKLTRMGCYDLEATLGDLSQAMH